MPDCSIVVITNGNYFARIILQDLLTRYSEQIRGIVLVTGDYKGRTGIRALLGVARVTALPYLIYKVATIGVFRVARLLPGRLGAELGNAAGSLSMPVITVESIRAATAYEFIDRHRPDLIVSVSCPQKVPTNLLQRARRGGINIHSSLLPRYAGLAPYFWVLSEGESTTGTTVHYMTEKFDEGNVLAQVQVPIRSRDSAFDLFKRLALAGRGILLDAVEKALSGDPGVPQNHAEYGYFSNPSLAAYLKLRRRGHRLARIAELIRILVREKENDMAGLPRAIG